jgi:hypothetical protein
MKTNDTFATISSDQLATATGGKKAKSSTDQAFDDMQRFHKENPDFSPGLPLCTRGYSEPCLH